jgi:UDP-N-acetylglucosamine--N-acetylmuramyl-(pentapeptide) pyrophosphoryl-undecaprenol N-acetylglucosamine transferase
MIAGGGTGGHAIPALCVAGSLDEKGAVVEFVGSDTGIEKDLVPQAGYALHSLPLRGLTGGPIARARAGLLFLKAVIRCRRLMKEFRPAAVFGVGGYASAPAVVAANALKIPTFLHEQNSVPGRVNRFTRRFTTELFVTFPAAREHLKNAVWVGMPTRQEFFVASREEALRHLDLEPPVVLLFGGSGGALKINLAATEAFGTSTPYTVVQISGRRDFARLSRSSSTLTTSGDIWPPRTWS